MDKVNRNIFIVMEIKIMKKHKKAKKYKKANKHKKVLTIINNERFINVKMRYVIFTKWQKLKSWIIQSVGIIMNYMNIHLLLLGTQVVIIILKRFCHFLIK